MNLSMLKYSGVDIPDMRDERMKEFLKRANAILKIKRKIHELRKCKGKIKWEKCRYSRIRHWKIVKSLNYSLYT
jgi:hypothetical protein